MTLDVTVQTEYQWRALSYIQELFSDMKKNWCKALSIASTPSGKGQIKVSQK